MKNNKKLSGRLSALLLTAMVGIPLLGGAFGEAYAQASERQGKTQVQAQASELTIHYLDVGQGDCILAECDGEYMLIDAGDNDQGTKIQNYLTKQGVKKLKYAVSTHPDADHIGGLDVILYKFDCGKVMMPDMSKDTATYRDVVDTMKQKGYRNTVPEPGDSFTLGGAVCTVLGPVQDYEDANNNSIVLKIEHGDNRFLFMGDAEEEAEADLIRSGADVEADVLKVGHHGSRSSSSRKFLQAVDPSCAVISCGEDNSYGHPHAETLNNLRAMGVEVFRSDEQGTILAVSDGSKITWNSAPSDSWNAGEPTGGSTAGNDGNKDKGQTPSQEGSRQNTGGTQIPTGEAPATGSYIGNKNNGKLHKASCNSLPMEKNQAVFSTREEAVAAGYDDPCKRCNP